MEHHEVITRIYRAIYKKPGLFKITPRRYNYFAVDVMVQDTYLISAVLSPDYAVYV